MQKRLHEFEEHDLVAEVRGVGLIAAMELKPHMTGGAGASGAKMNACLLENGVISRSIVDSVAFCPPMIITTAQIDDIMHAVSKSLDEIAAIRPRANA